jgi:hypothetical protein
MSRFPTTRFATTLLLILASLALAGCESITGPKQPVVYTTLPTRGVQATYPADFGKVYSAAQRVVRDELGYTLSDENKDSTTGKAGFDGKLADGSHVQVAMERSRDLATTSVQVFAVPAGSDTANTDRARDILGRIENIVAPAKK